MSVLLHICCAPCSVAVVDALRDEGLHVRGFWYNPNIQPHDEYIRRLETLRGYAASSALDITYDERYDEAEWLAMHTTVDALRISDTVSQTDAPNRCANCYRDRMRRAARAAREGGCESFTTTLLISPYQKHDLLRGIAEAAAAEEGIPFLYRDFRSLFRQGQSKAKELSLYRQRYCGCAMAEVNSPSPLHTQRPV